MCTNPKCPDYTTWVTHCTREDCCMMRCPVCQDNFVKTPNTVCSTCAPFQCEDCGKVTDYAISVKKNKFILDTQALELYEKEAAVGHCRRCRETVPLSKDRLCLNCCRALIPRTRLVCLACSEKDLQESWGERKRGICSQCFQAKDLNEYGVCKNCYNDYVATRVRCKDCLNWFTPTSGGAFCKRCRRKCYSCGTEFEPKLVTSCYCPSCESLINNGRCTICMQNRALNAYGHCADCAQEIKDDELRTFYCKGCELEVVEWPDTLCNDCQTRNKICKCCRSESAPIDQFLCYKCNAEYDRKREDSN